MEINVTLDASKIRPLVSKRSYVNKEGQNVEIQEVKFKLVPVKEPKTVYTDKAGKFTIDKTHFACQIKKDKNEATNYIGEGFTTKWTEEIKVVQAEIINDEPPF